MKHNPLIPMGAITGRPTREELRKRLDDYKKVGIDQFMIYPRTGAELEYMSEEWLEASRHIIEYASETGVSIWFYDEFNWPSGQCKGQVVKSNPEFCAKVLTLDKKENGQFIWDIAVCDEMADMLNPEAMNKFIKLTHEKYYQTFSQYFGKVIKGIFTDEPSYAYAVNKVKAKSGATVTLPYYEGLEEDYLKETGRGLRADIEKSLNPDFSGNLWSIFYNLIGERFKKSFFSPVRKWCDNHNILFTGHLMEEWTPGNSVLYSGTPLKCIREMSLPGIDEIFTKTDIEHIEWLTLNMVRGAALTQGHGAIVELFALGPADMPFGKLRQMIYLMAMHGVDHYVLAVSPLDARGNIEKDQYFTAFTPMQTYFNKMKLLSSATEKAASIASKKLASGRIAVRFPSTLASKDAASFLGSSVFPREMYASKKITKEFNALLQNMIRHQWPIKLVDESEKNEDTISAIIEMKQDGWTLETSDGKIHLSSSLDGLFKLMEEKLERSVAVLDADKSIANNLLVEEYEDCVVILNLTANDRPNLNCRGKGFSLPARGLKIIDNNTVSEEKGLPIASYSIQNFELSLERKNLMRCRFYNTPDGVSFRFFNLATNELQGIKLLFRRYSNNAKAILDGKEIECGNLSKELTPGLNELYMESKDFSLSPGEHELKLSENVTDVMFLPLAFFAGNFGLYPEFVLKDLPKRVSMGDIRADGLLNYAGKIILKSELTVPADAEFLHLATGEQITKVKIDGVSLGVRAWAPFEWQIPKNKKGKKVSCEIIQTLSIGAIFGEYDPNSTCISPMIDYLPGKFAQAGCIMPLEWSKKI